MTLVQKIMIYLLLGLAIVLQLQRNGIFFTQETLDIQLVELSSTTGQLRLARLTFGRVQVNIGLLVIVYLAVILAAVTLVELIRWTGPVLLAVLRWMTDLVSLCLAAPHFDVHLVRLTFELVEVNIGLFVQVPLPPFLRLGPIHPDMVLVDRAFGPVQFRVNFPRLSLEDGRIRAHFPVTVGLWRD